MMKNVIFWIRSIAFILIFYAVTALLCIIFIPTLFMPRRFTNWFPISWTYIVPRLLRILCGVKINFVGLENLPQQNGYIIASKHQSALETLLFHSLVPNAFFVLKRELIYIPVAGLYALKTGCVPIDRTGGAKTMRKMLVAVKKNIDQGMNLIIFPEGTRTKPGEKKPYSPGVALLYEQCQVPVVPVAVNSGYCWPKNQTKKIPGTVTVQFLKPIPTGLHRRAFLSELQDRIEEAQDNLPNPFGRKA